ncbi:MAG: methionine repressor-like protein [Proteobacteria bacterium]|nr:methionine repressor-like protein [Pseudomonadota bacterium]
MSTVRWSLKVSPDTDAAVRSFLGQTGGKKGDFSGFVETAVRERLQRAMQELNESEVVDGAFSNVVEAIRKRAAALTQKQVAKLVDDAVGAARKGA